ncbi:hypothetical protein TBLA_0B05570 [Henningerozyma blattae CBS 6284]|uniref:Uncharacterized protein n=1 Tax=Henningerozyma blattae (strain ATCC 34711 / CBS 6284 / DSM 70876 / NBRC 10599 / NRRL Y-10934 / UCD 77-7) TaxID=1071380 RepID=I2GZ33_HENB6|nr:hypothetical protein TBLA_0B05570 [Tetrapisispora blattae CBS 6284]CCH59385.1 hypothetical protein TBLA_0B05570 [Tetrapisispora blattae CBS 6284]
MRLNSLVLTAIIAGAEIVWADSMEFGLLAIKSGSSTKYANVYSDNGKLYFGSTDSALTAVVTDSGKLKLSNKKYVIVDRNGLWSETKDFKKASFGFAIQNGCLTYSGKNEFYSVRDIMGRKKYYGSSSASDSDDSKDHYTSSSSDSNSDSGHETSKDKQSGSSSDSSDDEKSDKDDYYDKYNGDRKGKHKNGKHNHTDGYSSGSDNDNDNYKHDSHSDDDDYHNYKVDTTKVKRSKAKRDATETTTDTTANKVAKGKARTKNYRVSAKDDGASANVKLKVMASHDTVISDFIPYNKIHLKGKQDDTFSNYSNSSVMNMTMPVNEEDSAENSDIKSDNGNVQGTKSDYKHKVHKDSNGANKLLNDGISVTAASMFAAVVAAMLI